MFTGIPWHMGELTSNCWRTLCVCHPYLSVGDAVDIISNFWLSVSTILVELYVKVRDISKHVYYRFLKVIFFIRKSEYIRSQNISTCTTEPCQVCHVKRCHLRRSSCWQDVNCGENAPISLICKFCIYSICSSIKFWSTFVWYYEKKVNKTSQYNFAKDCSLSYDPNKQAETKHTDRQEPFSNDVFFLISQLFFTFAIPALPRKPSPNQTSLSKLNVLPN